MPKQAGITLNGIKFEDALKKMLATPPPPSSKKAQTKRTKNRRKSV
jgi:hypothetical protein